MSTVFLFCVGLGTTILIAQIVLTAVGLGGHGDLDPGHVEVADLDAGDAPDGHGGPSELAHGLDLLSVRALSAALAIFGVAGMALDRFFPTWLAAALALIPALLTALATAWLTRQMLRLESSGSLRLEGAVGLEGSVYLTVPAGSAASDRRGPGHGLVHVAIQGRTVELRAVTRDTRDLPTGSSVVVISVQDDGETVEVVPPSTLEDPSS